MPVLEVKLTLPESLAREAEANGLLVPQALEQMLREAIRRRRVDKLFTAADQIAACSGTPMTAEEIEAEIEAAREARRGATGRQ